jgi:hypothetical protein
MEEKIEVDTDQEVAEGVEHDDVHTSLWKLQWPNTQSQHDSLKVTVIPAYNECLRSF